MYKKEDLTVPVPQTSRKRGETPESSFSPMTPSRLLPTKEVVAPPVGAKCSGKKPGERRV